MTSTYHTTEWQGARVAPCQVAVGLFLAYVLASTQWATSPDILRGVLETGAFCLFFFLGAYVPSLRPLGPVLGCVATASALLGVCQWLGYFHGTSLVFPAGIFWNGSVQGDFLGFVIVLLVVDRLWWYIPALIPALFFTHSRGGLAIVAVGLTAHFVRKPLVLIVLLLSITLAVLLWPTPGSDRERFDIWEAAWLLLTPWGEGAGSFMSVIISTSYGMRYPMFVHNDYLQLAFEYGVASLLLLAPLAWAACRVARTEWPLLVTFIFASCFDFPMHVPVFLAIFGLVAGHLSKIEGR